MTLRLIGMLDSPFVRRVAVSLRFYGLPFEHEQLSVFRSYDAFAAINPMVKAPSLVTEEGVVLVDSTLILDYLEGLVPAAQSLVAFLPGERAYAYRLIGLGVAACEKAVQLVYERQLRPANMQLPSWEKRVIGQIKSTFELIEHALPEFECWLFADGPRQPEITLAVAWRFAQEKHEGLLDPADFPKLCALAERAEALPEFKASPYEE